MVAQPVNISHNPAASRFEAWPDGQLAECSYRLRERLLVLHHTQVPAAAEGRGVAAALVQAALDWARAQGLQVLPSCSYVAAYMRRHPHTLDLLQPPPTPPSA